ncbi:hypothetical protein KFL_002330120 [Klebsormidium nitens]|uniref:Uncharacterized protein n=1 Tax=Klebsormidium nitens TaxID=105231 RepID=A0A1Y1I621_KLENI|nr:hypothetical protein KFL_002330120 [Klebsormidium nitens]|eukprot:GAQ85402.1 hypothetical protein KFL_002330120 [Klebsormidium nitens]
MNSLLAAYSNSDSDSEVDPAQRDSEARSTGEAGGAEAVTSDGPAASRSSSPFGVVIADQQVQSDVPSTERQAQVQSLPAAEALFVISSRQETQSRTRLPAPFASSLVRDLGNAGTIAAFESSKRSGNALDNGGFQRQAKTPKLGGLPASRASVSSTLLPPQLRGRSNVATEDLEKIFVKREKK